MDSYVKKPCSKYPLDSPHNVKLTEPLLKMICLDCEPFRIVERTGFVEFITLLEPRFAIPTRHTLTNKYLDSVYSATCSKVQQDLNFTKYVHVTSDIWTDVHKQISYITITSHFLDKNMKIKCYNLCTLQFGVSHTGQNIYEQLLNNFTKWNISDKVLSQI